MAQPVELFKVESLSAAERQRLEQYKRLLKEQQKPEAQWRPFVDLDGTQEELKNHSCAMRVLVPAYIEAVNDLFSLLRLEEGEFAFRKDLHLLNREEGSGGIIGATQLFSSLRRFRSKRIDLMKDEADVADVLFEAWVAQSDLSLYIRTLPPCLQQEAAALAHLRPYLEALMRWTKWMRVGSPHPDGAIGLVLQLLVAHDSHPRLVRIILHHICEGIAALHQTGPFLGSKARPSEPADGPVSILQQPWQNSTVYAEWLVEKLITSVIVLATPNDEPLISTPVGSAMVEVFSRKRAQFMEATYWHRVPKRGKEAAFDTSAALPGEAFLPHDGQPCANWPIMDESHNPFWLQALAYLGIEFGAYDGLQEKHADWDSVTAEKLQEKEAEFARSGLQRPDYERMIAEARMRAVDGVHHKVMGAAAFHAGNVEKIIADRARSCSPL